jgi:hypothetical protein
MFFIGRSESGKVYELTPGTINKHVRAEQERIYSAIKTYIEKHKSYKLEYDSIYNSKGEYTGAIDDLVFKFRTNE